MHRHVVFECKSFWSSHSIVENAKADLLRPSASVLQLTLSGDCIATMRRPVLQLTLTLQNADGQVESVLMELQKAELDELIAAIDSAYATIDRLQA